MNLLLDTHAVIWFITDDEQLPISVKQMIEDGANNCFVSIASLWEMGIKYSLGRLDLKSDLVNIFEIIGISGLIILPITTAHILENSKLDFHHRDPFDRLIIAQSISEELTLISKDGDFKDYGVKVIWID